MRPGDHSADIEAIAKQTGQSPLVVLEIFNERAALREYEGGLTRDEAERLAVLDTAEALGVSPSQQANPTPRGAS